MQRVSSLSPAILFGCFNCPVHLCAPVAGQVSGALEIQGHARSASGITSEGDTVTRSMAGTFEFNCILRFCCGTDEALDGNYKKT